MSGSWRDIAAPIIAEVIAEVGIMNTINLKRALRDAYPFGERKYWPYKAWCAEVNHQLGKKPTKSLKAIEDRATGDLFA